MNNAEYILKKIDNYFYYYLMDYNPLGELIYNYESTSIETITNALNIIKDREVDYSGMTFIDVGSGLGNMCGVAVNMGFHAEGIEINPKAFEMSMKIHPDVKFHNIDIRDFPNYEKYDIVFYYAPFQNEEMQRKLKTNIEDTIRIGSYIIAWGWYFEKVKDERFIDLGNYVWQKIS